MVVVGGGSGSAGEQKKDTGGRFNEAAVGPWQPEQKFSHCCGIVSIFQGSASLVPCGSARSLSNTPPPSPVRARFFELSRSCLKQKAMTARSCRQPVRPAAPFTLRCCSQSSSLYLFPLPPRCSLCAESEPVLQNDLQPHPWGVTK